MPAPTPQPKRPHPVASGALNALLRGAVALCLGLSLNLVAAQEPMSAQSEAPPLVSAVVVAYVAEVPWPSYAGMANPLERWARQLSASWTAPASEPDTRLNNLRPGLSLEHMLRDAANETHRKADLYMIHGYELLEQSKPAVLEALLTPSCNGRASKVEFVVLRRRDPSQTAGHPFSFNELSQKTVMVDRGGCGELVYRWLNVELVPHSGDLRRENYAEFRAAANATEAVLSVYFGEADACVVTREDFVSVVRTNPHSLQAKLEEACHSPQLLRHVVACRAGLTDDIRKELMIGCSKVRMPFQGIVWSLTPTQDEDMSALRTLIEQWHNYLPSGPGAIAPDAATRSKVKSGVAASASGERRQP